MVAVTSGSPKAVMMANMLMLVMLVGGGGKKMTRAKLRTARTDSGVGKRSQAGLSLLDEIDASTRRFCAILSRDLGAQEKRRSFT